MIKFWTVTILSLRSTEMSSDRTEHRSARCLHSGIHPITWRADGEAEIGVGILYFAGRLSGGIAVIWRAPVCVMTSQNSHRIVTEIVIFHTEGK